MGKHTICITKQLVDMMNKPNKSGAMARSGLGTATTNAGRDAGELPPWLKFGLPAGLALLAAILNMAAVQRQIRPIRVLAVTQNLPIGTLLTIEHLKEVQIAGDFSKGPVVSLQDLLVADGPEGRSLTLEASLKSRPRILVRAIDEGELLTHASLGGHERARAGEELVYVPVDMIRGGGDGLVPGQLIYMLAHRRDGRDGPSETITIGPFRVCYQDPNEMKKKTGRAKNETIPLVYRLTSSGDYSKSATILRAAVVENAYSLAVLEKNERPAVDTAALTSRTAGLQAPAF